MRLNAGSIALMRCLRCSTEFAGNHASVCPDCGFPGRIADPPLPDQLPIALGWSDWTTRPPERALPSKVECGGTFSWSAWVREPGGLWFLVSWHWTRRGALKAAERFSREAPMTSAELDDEDLAAERLWNHVCSRIGIIARWDVVPEPEREIWRRMLREERA